MRDDLKKGNSDGKDQFKPQPSSLTPQTSSYVFPFEKLDVYQMALELASIHTLQTFF
jgi:hypothetical protein